MVYVTSNVLFGKFNEKILNLCNFNIITVFCVQKSLNFSNKNLFSNVHINIVCKLHYKSGQKLKLKLHL